MSQQQLHRPGLLQSSGQASHRQQALVCRPSAQRAPVQQQQWQLRQHQHRQQQLHNPGGSSSSRQQVACKALFGFLRGGGDKGSSSKLAEKPLYAKRDMFDLGGLQVSDCGGRKLAAAV
jgi:hypothetical protein